jgi:hypothetical protein
MKKNLKLEKEFYSEKNFKILEEVLLETVDKNKLKDNYKLFIFNSMEQVFNNIKIPENLNTKDKKKYLTLLNKQVLSNIVSNSQSQNHLQQPQQHLQQPQQHLQQPQQHLQQPQQHLQQPQHHPQQPQHHPQQPQQHLQQPQHHPQQPQQHPQHQSQSIQQYKEVKPFQSFETSTINSTQFSIFPESNLKNRDLQTFYSRNFTPPVSNPILHPEKQIENFPPPQQDRTPSNNTKKMFSKIEEERNNEKNIKKPPQIDFTLPLNTKENINHENKFQELMKKREIDDITLNKDLNTDKNILNSNEIDNSKTNSYIQEIDNSKTNSYIKEIDNSKTNSYKIHQEIDNSFFSNKNSNLEYNSIVDGLDENLLNMDDIIDTPNIKHPNISNQFNQFPERHVQSPERQNNKSLERQNNKSPERQNNKSLERHNNQSLERQNNQSPEKIEKTIYLTILSKYRNTDKYPSPTNFTLSLKKKESNIVKLSDEILFKEIFPDEHNEFILNDIININNIISIECLDVVIPKNNFILHEPYLWLCINEWSSSNIGTGVPNGAFARLKPISFDKESPYITLRPHILERQSPLKMSDTLTLKIVTSDGEEIDIEDRVELKTIQSANNSICLETDKNIKENDLIYIYSLYDDVIGFYPNVYIHNLTVNKLKQNISFRLFLDKDANISDNKIGKFIDKDTKIRIIASKYLSVGDLFVIDIDKETNKYKILDIKDDIITIDYKKNIKKITRIGFIKQKKEGYSSKNKQDIHYKSGVQIKNVDVSESISKLHLKNYTFDNTNKYFFLQRNKQISYMFRITYLES